MVYFAVEREREQEVIFHSRGCIVRVSPERVRRAESDNWPRAFQKNVDIKAFPILWCKKISVFSAFLVREFVFILEGPKGMGSGVRLAGGGIGARHTHKLAATVRGGEDRSIVKGFR